MSTGVGRTGVVVNPTIFIDVLNAHNVGVMHEEDVSVADLIIEAMPFSDELNLWCQLHPSFKAGLKFSNDKYFLPIGIVFTSHPKNAPSDQIIGFLVYDKKEGYFKQDYIFNKGGQNKKFILYSKLPDALKHSYDAFVQPITTLFTKYDVEGGYERDHHLTIEQVDEIATRIGQPYLSEMAHKMMGSQYRSDITQEELKQVLELIRAQKAKDK